MSYEAARGDWRWAPSSPESSNDTKSRNAPDHRPRWRQHLSEMDYLREGIHLRGIAQTDRRSSPGQREAVRDVRQAGWTSIDDDWPFRFVTHLEVVLAEEAAPDLRPSDLRRRPTIPVAEPSLGDSPTVPRPDPKPAWSRAAATPAARHRRRLMRRVRPSPPAAAGSRRSSPSLPPPPSTALERQARSERPVLVREREEVQGLPRQGSGMTVPSPGSVAGSDSLPVTIPLDLRNR